MLRDAYHRRAWQIQVVLVVGYYYLHNYIKYYNYSSVDLILIYLFISVEMRNTFLILGEKVSTQQAYTWIKSFKEW